MNENDMICVVADMCYYLKINGWFH
jgi:hypothetical protein